MFLSLRTSHRYCLIVSLSRFTDSDVHFAVTVSNLGWDNFLLFFCYFFLPPPEAFAVVSQQLPSLEHFPIDHSPVTVKLYATQRGICTQSSKRTSIRKMDAIRPSETSVNLNENTGGSISEELYHFQLFSFWQLT